LHPEFFSRIARCGIPNEGGVLMPAWGWVLIAVGAVLLVAVVAWRALAARRTTKLRDHFGPEYDRTVDRTKSRRQAESALTAREKRREELQIRPLTAAASARYDAQWTEIQARFVDAPQAAVAAADALIQDVMRERGYPVADFEQRADDVSVDHPQVVENYREGHRLAERSAVGKGTTEDLRLAMRHYRALFTELVEPPADEPSAGERAASDRELPVDETTREAVR
jgi:hypothetical protein